MTYRRMNKCLKIILITFLIFSGQLNAQNSKKNKCFVEKFDFNKKYELKEIDCSEIIKFDFSSTKEQEVKSERFRLKMIAYQKKLIGLGYNVDVNGLEADTKTIKAHNKFIKKKRKEEKRKLRREKTK